MQREKRKITTGVKIRRRPLALPLKGFLGFLVSVSSSALVIFQTSYGRGGREVLLRMASISASERV
jgi:hypothetical protein